MLAAARWYPEREREDFVDEMIGMVDCYADDGRTHRARWVGVSEWSTALWHRGDPAWMLSERSNGLAHGLVNGLAMGLASGLILGLDNGLAKGLILGPFCGLFSGLAGGLLFGVVSGLADGLGGFNLGPSFWYGPRLAQALLWRLRAGLAATGN